MIFGKMFQFLSIHLNTRTFILKKMGAPWQEMIEPNIEPRETAHFFLGCRTATVHLMLGSR